MAKYPTLKVQRLSPAAYLPVRGTEGSSGLDVFSPIDTEVPARGSVLIPLDLRFEIPYGWDLSVYNKSGVSTKLKLFKGAELIDSDYRGTVHIHLFNHSDETVKISKGQKISQLVMREVWMGDVEESDNISTETERGQGGFGSTDRQGTSGINHPGAVSGSSGVTGNFGT
jgi:dUTP pyrophosphatase